jgi:hypothetical protein
VTLLTYVLGLPALNIGGNTTVVMCVVVFFSPPLKYRDSTLTRLLPPYYASFTIDEDCYTIIYTIRPSGVIVIEQGKNK